MLRKACELYGETDGNRKTSYDVVATYYCLYPATPFLTLGQVNGTNTVNSSTGVNTWSATAGTHNRIAFTASGAGVIQLASETVLNDASWP